MFCVIYRVPSVTRLVFMSKKDDFSRVPEVLLKGFGKPQLAMLLPLDYK